MSDVILKSERLILRGFRPEDSADLYEYLSDEQVVKYEPYDAFTEEECIAEASRRAGDSSFWAVCLKDTGKLIGNLYFQRQVPAIFQTWEIGFVFNARYQKQGYAAEACTLLLRYAFKELGAHRIIGLCNPDNTASWRLMERMNMRREGHHRKPAFFTRTEDGKPLWHDSYEYAIIDEEWFAQQNK